MTEVRLTIVDPARTGAVVDVVASGEPGTTLALLTAGLLASVGRSEPDNVCAAAVFSIEGVEIPATQRLGAAPLLDGAVLRVRGSAEGSPPEPGLLEVHVVAGPDAGRVFSLPPGSHEVGRGPACAVRVDDEDVSRVHAVLRVGTDATTVTDAGSTHGTSVAGATVGAEPVVIAPGTTVTLGSSRLELRIPESAPASLTPDSAGHLLVNRRPQLSAAPADVVVEFPAEPERRPPAKLPWLVMLLPMAVSLAVAAVLRQPLFLLFALTTPALMAGQYLSERRSARREKRRQLASYDSELIAAQSELDRFLLADRELEEHRLPDLAHLARAAQLPGADVWRRSPTDPDLLHVRLGRGAVVSRVRRADPAGRGSGGRGSGGRGSGTVMHPDVPVGLDLLAHGVIGICGPTRTALARSLIGQLATLHSPHDVALDVMEVGPGDAWRFVRWLPHHRADRTALRVTLLDDATRLRRSPGVVELLTAALAATSTQGAEPREIVVCLAEDAARLPMECTATVELLPPGAPGHGARAVLHRKGSQPVEFLADLPGPAWAEVVARSLAPLRDATPSPRARVACPALTDLLAAVDGVRVDDPADLARHWRRGPDYSGPGGSGPGGSGPGGSGPGGSGPGGSGPVATVGTGGGGPVRIDLRRDGPHALIGGTTGSGKSELLLSLVTALAADRAPSEITFLLVDYKGGAAFQACVGLPHVAGVITDLDPHLASRALASLQAELRRRERLLAAAGARDLDGYAAVAAAGFPLPRLVVVVDEFRVLAEELPDFVHGLVRIAAVGRSLGVHLVLATQRPAGVVSAEIRANTALRIALRVRDVADSHDLIEAPDAATIPASEPGRAFARIGGDLTAFQVSSVLAGRRRPRPPSVRPLGAEPLEAAPGAAAGEPGELDRIVTAMRGAAGLLGLPAVQRPWLPPLPERLSLRGVLELAWSPDRPASAGRPAEGREAEGRVAEGSLSVPLGLADRPERQRQEPAGWNPGSGHLGVFGGPRSGRTTALVTVAYALAARYGQHEVHIYAIDAAGGRGSGGRGSGGRGSDGRGLDRIGELPHCGAVIPAADTERCARLLAHLRNLIDGVDGVDGVVDEPGGSGCPVVVLIDGWESLSARWAGVDHGALLDQLTAVLRDGTRHGIHLVVAGGRSLLTGAVSSLLSERLVLRFADPTDAVLAGVRKLGRQPPGRGVLVRTGDPDGCETHIATTDFVIAPEPDALDGPLRLRELPTRVAFEDLVTRRRVLTGIAIGTAGTGTGAGAGAGAGSLLRVPIGIGGDSAEPICLVLDLPGVTVVHGSPGSGRSTALATIAAGLHGGRTPTIEVQKLEPGECLHMLADDPDAVVLVDDAARLTDPALELALVERVRANPRRPRIVVVVGPGELVTAFRGLAAEARTSRYGIMLGAITPADAGVLGIGSLLRPAGPAGRGRLVEGSSSVPVQLAVPPAVPPAQPPAQPPAAELPLGRAVGAGQA